MYYIILFFSASIFVSCSDFKEQKVKHKIFSELEGIWQLENSTTFELWKIKDSNLVGKLVKVEQSDTLILEHLRIFINAKDLFYEATVMNQNDALPIKFKLVSINNNEYMFENKNHDFPKKITYSFQNKNIFIAKISGNNKTITFKYVKFK